jgi:hypothetical protein
MRGLKNCTVANGVLYSSGTRWQPFVHATSALAIHVASRGDIRVTEIAGRLPDGSRDQGIRHHGSEAL